MRFKRKASWLSTRLQARLEWVCNTVLCRRRIVYATAEQTEIWTSSLPTPTPLAIAARTDSHRHALFTGKVSDSCH